MAHAGKGRRLLGYKDLREKGISWSRQHIGNQIAAHLFSAPFNLGDSTVVFDVGIIDEHVDMRFNGLQPVYFGCPCVGWMKPVDKKIQAFVSTGTMIGTFEKKADAIAAILARAQAAASADGDKARRVPA
jgi:hypothetical protein